MSHIDGIQRRYEAVIQSFTEEGFYLNCFYYFDYIYSNPDLYKIYEEAYKDYSKKFGNIWGDWNDGRRQYLESGRTIEPPEVTNQPDEVYRLETFDMFCNSCGLDVRVYHPIKHYKECEHELCNDYNGWLLVRGLEATLVRYKGHLRISPKSIKHTYKNWYQNKREDYQGNLSRFNIQFIDKVRELDILVVPEAKTIKPFLNSNTGDFSYFGKKGNFPISGQEFKVLKTLHDNLGEPVTHLELIKSFIPSVTEAREAHKMTLRDVLKNIKIKLGVLSKNGIPKPDPIRSIRQYGYRLEIKE